MRVIQSADHRKNLWKNKNSTGGVGFKVHIEVNLKAVSLRRGKCSPQTHKSLIDSVAREVWWLFSLMCSAALFWRGSQSRQSQRYVSLGRVLSFFSSRSNWDSPTPSTAGDCGGGGAQSPAGEGVSILYFRTDLFSAIAYLMSRH